MSVEEKTEYLIANYGELALKVATEIKNEISSYFGAASPSQYWDNIIYEIKNKL